MPVLLNKANTMNSQTALVPSSKEVQQEATLMDLHIHPSMGQQIFRRDVRLVHAFTYDWDLQPARANFPKMKQGGYDVFMSVLYVPEKGLLGDFPLLNILRLLHPGLWRKLITRDSFDTVNAMLDD